MLVPADEAQRRDVAWDGRLEAVQQALDLTVVEVFERLAKTVRKHRDGILAAVRLGLTNARAEALNNKVRLITRRAYGFHTPQALIALVMLTLNWRDPGGSVRCL